MRTISFFLVAPGALPTIFLAQTGDRLFPVTDSITEARPVYDFREQWYSKHLIAMGEPRLSGGPNEVYRFLWLRIFANPIVIRITCDPKGCDLIAKRLDGSGGYEPGKVAGRKERRLSDEEVTNVRRLLSKAQFWGRQPNDERIGLDGAQWILEGRREGSYHLWDVWSPERVGPYGDFRELCLELLRQSGLMIRSSEIY
jgi:hypothetical protein